MNQKSWYLVKCKPKQDMRALTSLQQQGYECLLPKQEIEFLRNGKWISRQEALFPGYLFISLDTLHDNWMPIRSTRGVSHIVRFNVLPTPVPPAVIERIQKRTTAPSQMIQAGEKLLIRNDGEEFWEALFLSKDGADRALLLLKILQQEVEVSVSASRLIKLT